MGNRKATKRPIKSMDKSEKMLYGLKRQVNLYQISKNFVDWKPEEFGWSKK